MTLKYFLPIRTVWKYFSRLIAGFFLDISKKTQGKKKLIGMCWLNQCGLSHLYEGWWDESTKSNCDLTSGTVRHTTFEGFCVMSLICFVKEVVSKFEVDNNRKKTWNTNETDFILCLHFWMTKNTVFALRSKRIFESSNFSSLLFCC